MAAQAFAARFDGILLGTAGAGQFIGEMGVVENRPRSATVQAASEVEVEFLTPTEFVDQRISQRLRDADEQHRQR
jgi:CRP-like cAMP-binding protein